MGGAGGSQVQGGGRQAGGTALCTRQEGGSRDVLQAVSSLRSLFGTHLPPTLRLSVTGMLLFLTLPLSSISLPAPAASCVTYPAAAACSHPPTHQALGTFTLPTISALNAHSGIVMPGLIPACHIGTFPPFRHCHATGTPSSYGWRASCGTSRASRRDGSTGSGSPCRSTSPPERADCGPGSIKWTRWSCRCIASREAIPPPSH